MSDHIDLNAAAPQTLAPKRGRGRPRKNPPPPPPTPTSAIASRPPPAAPDPAALAAAGAGSGSGAVGSFAPKDLVWGKKLAHPSWPGEVLSVASGGTQLLVSFFGEKALAWCDAAQLRPYEAYFSVGELYDGEADDFDAAVDASLDEFSRRVQAALTGAADAPASLRRPFVPLDFITSLQDLAADRMGFSNRVQAAITKAHLRAFDEFRGLPDPPVYTLELGIVSADASATATPKGRGVKAAAVEVNGDYSSTPPSRRGRKRKEEVQEADSDEDWDPRKKGGSDSDTDVDMGRKRPSRGKGSAPRGGGTGRPRGRPRKTDAPRPSQPQVKDEEVEEKVEYPSAAELLLQLTSVAADPFNFKDYDSVNVIFSFFSKHKDAGVPSDGDDKERLETLCGKKGRKGYGGSFTKAEHETDEEQLEAADGQRGRRRSAGGIYSARKAEDSYWCDIIISDFDDGDSDYEGSKRKRASQNRNGNKKTKQEVAPQDEASTPQIP